MQTTLPALDQRHDVVRQGNMTTSDNNHERRSLLSSAAVGLRAPRTAQQHPAQTELSTRFERDALPLRDTLYRHASLWCTRPTVTYVINALIDQPTALSTAWLIAQP